MHCFNHITQIGFGVEVMHEGALNHGEKDGVAFGAFDGGAKQAVLAMQGIGPHATLGAVIIDGSCADGAVSLQSVPEIEGVTGSAANARFWQNRRIGLPGAEGFMNLGKNRLGTLLSLHHSFIGWQLGDISFEVIGISGTRIISAEYS